jgi:hypothetical protein
MIVDKSSRISSIIAINSVVSHVKQRKNDVKRQQFIYYSGWYPNP